MRRSGTGTNLRRTARLKLRIARLEALAARRAAHDAWHKDQAKTRERQYAIFVADQAKRATEWYAEKRECRDMAANDDHWHPFLTEDDLEALIT